jgi:hypothetical protein
MRASGRSTYYKIDLGTGAKVEELATKPSLRRGKNCDEQFTHLGRVRLSVFMIKNHACFVLAVRK